MKLSLTFLTTVLGYLFFLAAQLLFLVGVISLQKIVYFGPILLPKILAQAIFLEREQLSQLIQLINTGGLFGLFIALMLIVTPMLAVSLLLISISWILLSREAHTKWVLPTAVPGLILAAAYAVMPAVPDLYIGQFADSMAKLLIVFIFLQTLSLIAFFFAARRRIFLLAGLFALPAIGPAAYSLSEVPQAAFPIINGVVSLSLATSSAMALAGFLTSKR